MRRGDVFALTPPKGIGHEQSGRRFGVVIQSDAMLPRSVVLLAPTSASARAASFRPEIKIRGRTTRVLVEQMGEVDVSRLGNRAGHLHPGELWEVDDAILIVTGLDR